MIATQNSCVPQAKACGNSTKACGGNSAKICTDPKLKATLQLLFKKGIRNYIPELPRNKSRNA